MVEIQKSHLCQERQRPWDGAPSSPHQEDVRNVPNSAPKQLAVSIFHSSPYGMGIIEYCSVKKL